MVKINFDEKFKGSKGEWACVQYADQTYVQVGELYGDMDILNLENTPKAEVIANINVIENAKPVLKALIDANEWLRWYASSVPMCQLKSTLEAGVKANDELILKSLGIG